MALAISNPFTLGLAEDLDEESSFLNLFEPSILESVPLEEARARPLFRWLSSEGGGKTSLLRIFTPTMLREVSKYRRDVRLRQLLVKAGAIAAEENAALMLGILTKVTISYPYIEDLPLERNQKKRLLYALLNARLTLRFLTAIAESRGEPLTGILSTLQYELPLDLPGLPPDLATKGTGLQLARWAEGVQRAAMRIIDGADDAARAPGHDALHAPLLCDPARWTLDGMSLASLQAIIMLDDAQELPRDQLEWIVESATRNREGSRIWLASRLNALDPDIIFPGTQQGRDYSEHRLESSWLKGAEKNRSVDWAAYGDFLREIGNKRLKIGEASVTDFKDFLEEDLDNTALKDALGRQIETTESRIAALTKNVQRFKKWIEWARSADVAAEHLLRTREVEILIHRDFNSPNDAITDEPFTIKELETKRGAALRAAAAALASTESAEGKTGPAVPLYYGFEMLVQLSNFNVQQFLKTCKELYDASLDREIRGESPRLSASTQDLLVRKAAAGKWDQVRKSHRDGEKIQAFLTAIASRLKEEFARPTAPYPPAPVGISLPIEEYEQLKDGKKLPASYAGLRNALAHCVAHNFLNVRDRHDKSQPVRVFYLNGLILAHHGLPVVSAQFQPARLSDLHSWYEKGYTGKRTPKASLARRKRKSPEERARRSRQRQRLDDFGAE